MTKALRIALILVLTISLFGCLFEENIEKQAKSEMDKIEHQVALDTEKQYNIAKRNGSAMDAYVHAGLVAAAYLQAEDEENYKKWKKIEEEEAKQIGL